MELDVPALYHVTLALSFCHSKLLVCERVLCPLKGLFSLALAFYITEQLFFFFE